MNTGLRLSVAAMLSGVLSFIGMLFIGWGVGFEGSLSPGYYCAVVIVVILGGIVGWVACPKYTPKPGDPKIVLNSIITLFSIIGGLGFSASIWGLSRLFAGR